MFVSPLPAVSRIIALDHETYSNSIVLCFSFFPYRLMVYTIVCFLFKLCSIGRIEVFLTLLACLLIRVSGFRVGQLGESVAER